MRTRPTLVQTLLKQPSQTYSKPDAHAKGTKAVERPQQPSSTFIKTFRLPLNDTEYVSEAEEEEGEPFYTPPESPSKVSSPMGAPQFPHMSSSSSLSSFDDIFSLKSTSASLTSVSSRSASPPAKAPSHTRRTQKNKDWSKDVRWLVAPNAASRRPRSLSARSSSSVPQRDWLRPQVTYLHGIELVEVESDPGFDKRMSAVWEEDEDLQDDTSQNTTIRRPRTLLAPSNTASVSSYQTVTLPVPLPISSGHIPFGAFQSLTLPHTFQPADNPEMPTGKVNLVKAGIAQSSISSISITRRSSTPTPGHLQQDVSAALGLTAHRQPPTYVPPHSLIVRVHAVGLDGVDLLLVQNRVSKKNGFDYIPGRSFVGQAVEVGWAAKKLTKGNWVCGLMDFKSAGALSQFVVVESKRVTPISVKCGGLTMDQIALFPLCGVPAHRAVNTLRYLPKAASILVLHAHAGSGLFATQELLSLGYSHVVAHIPDKAMEKRVLDWGVENIMCGDAIVLLEKATERKFDAVIDPIGGKPIWHAARKVLKPSSHFITLIGDLGSQTPSAFTHFKASMRTLHRAWSKGIEYTWISPAADVDLQGDAIRDTLSAVVQLAQKRRVIPHISGVVSADGEITPIKYDPYQRLKEGEAEEIIPVFGLNRKKLTEYGWADDLTGVIDAVGREPDFGHSRRQTWAGARTAGFNSVLSSADSSDFEEAPSSVTASAPKDVMALPNHPATPTGIPGPAGTATCLDVEGLSFKFERAAEAFTFNLRTGMRLLEGGGTAVVKLLD